MPRLTLALLGPARIAADGRLLDLRVRKELALLVFLAVEQQRWRRESVLGLLWPDVPEEAARNNLRGVLAGLRRALGAAAELVLVADRQYVQFAPQGDHALDVALFRGLLAAVAAHAHAAVERCEVCIPRLSEAAELYRGDFLAGFGLPDSAPFEEWASVQREQLHQQQLDTLDTLATAHELGGDHAGQCAYARQQLALEPWRESAYAQLMRGLQASGQRGAALEQFELCRRILADELGLEPSPELTILAEQLRGDARRETRDARPETRDPRPETLYSDSSSLASPPLASPRWPDLPAVARLYGREGELARVERWLVDERCRLVALLGIGGVGKTTLAAAAASAVAGHFEAVVWRSLLNAPPLDELLRDVLYQLAPGAPLALSRSDMEGCTASVCCSQAMPPNTCARASCACWSSNPSHASSSPRRASTGVGALDAPRARRPARCGAAPRATPPATCSTCSPSSRSTWLTTTSRACACGRPTCVR